MPDPIGATVSEAWEHLDRQHRKFLDAVTSVDYALWLGSGVSRERVPGLPGLVETAIERLQANATTASGCPYAAALADVFRLVPSAVLALSGTPTPSPSVPIATWPVDAKKAIIQVLTNEYSRLLEIEVRLPGRPTAPLAHAVLDIVSIYANPTGGPDAEHDLVALLLVECIFQEVVTINWDPLVELAWQKWTGKADLPVAVRSDELGRCSKPPWLLKAHGCAALAKADLRRYGPCLLFGAQQFLKATAGYAHAHIQAHLKVLLDRKPALFVGLSGQDANLRREFLNTVASQTPWKAEPPRIAFAVSKVESPQQDILRALHASDYGSQPAAVERSATLGLYAKPLLGALYLHALAQKATDVIVAGDAEFQKAPGHRSLAQYGVSEGLRAVRQRFDAEPDSCARWRRLVAEFAGRLGRFSCVYRKPGQVPDHYEALVPTVRPGPSASEVGDGNHHRLLVLLGALLEGQSRGYWQLSFPEDVAADGQVVVGVGGRQIRVHVLRNEQTGRSALESRVTLGPEPEVVVLVHGYRSTTPSSSGPGSRLGASAAPEPAVEICWSATLEDHPDVDQLIEDLRQELSRAIP